LLYLYLLGLLVEFDHLGLVIIDQPVFRTILAANHGHSRAYDHCLALFVGGLLTIRAIYQFGPKSGGTQPDLRKSYSVVPGAENDAYNVYL
jgi:hypothetical protein